MKEPQRAISEGQYAQRFGLIKRRICETSSIDDPLVMPLKAPWNFGPLMRRNFRFSKGSGEDLRNDLWEPQNTQIVYIIVSKLTNGVLGVGRLKKWGKRNA